MTGRLQGKRAFITGAARGIGAAGAILFAREGASVMCTDIDEEALEQVVATIRSAGGTAIAMRCDVSREADIQGTIAATVEAFGGLEVAWANAGAPAEGRAGDISVDLWERTLNLNLTSAWLTAKHALPHLIASGRGSLIFTASCAGMQGSPNVSAYAAAKAGVIGFARQLAVDYAAQNVRANVVAPGLSVTKMVSDAYGERARQFGVTYEELLKRSEEGYPLQRLGTPEDQANLALFFASDESSWMTGHAIGVDGGRLAKF
jgi:NAD(P)-dependent dehydrogenase (short-subunit alcohol dehydrogenase family)